MKITKKILLISPIIMSTFAIGTSVSCSKSDFDMIDLSNSGYKPTIKPYEPNEGEKGGVNESQAKTIYLEQLTNNLDILKQDLYYHEVKQYSPSIGFTTKLGFKITKIDQSSSLIDFDLIESVSGKVSAPIAYSNNYSINISVKNAPIELSYLTYWSVVFGKPEAKVPADLGEMIINGSVSGYQKYSSESKTIDIQYTGTQFHITKNFVSPTIEQEKNEVSMIFNSSYRTINSYYLQKLLYKAS